jgi:hypothetical protein
MIYGLPISAFLLPVLVLIIRSCVESFRLNHPKPPEPSERNFDTTKLVVGQEVVIFDLGQSRDFGRVIKISPSGDVEINVCDKLFLRFDRDGMGEIGPGQHPSVEYGPWFIDDTPVAEHLAHPNEIPFRDIRALLGKTGDRRD